MPDTAANTAAATRNETVSVLDMAENADDYALLLAVWNWIKLGKLTVHGELRGEAAMSVATASDNSHSKLVAPAQEQAGIRC